MGLLDSLSSSPDQGTTTPVANSVQPTAPQDNGQVAYNFFVDKGYAPHQAAGIVGNLQGESGQGLNPNAVNRGDGRDGSDSIGIGQWNGTRAQALKDYAAANNLPVNDINTQLQFLHQELQGTESGANKRLMAATSPEEAGNAMLAYERPKDWNKPGAHPERAQYAAKAFAAYGAQQPVQTAQNAPAVQPSPPLNITAPITNSASQASQIPSQPAPVFAAQQQMAQAIPAINQIPAAPMPPIFAAPHRQIDLSKLRAALASRAPIFPQG